MHDKGPSGYATGGCRTTEGTGERRTESASYMGIYPTINSPGIDLGIIQLDFFLFFD